MKHPNHCKCVISKPDTGNVSCMNCGCVIQYGGITKIEIDDIEEGSTDTTLIKGNFGDLANKLCKLSEAFDDYIKDDLDDALVKALIKFNKEYAFIGSEDLQTFVSGWDAAIEFINNKK